MPKRRGILLRRHNRSPIDYCESALPPTDQITVPRRALTRSFGSDLNDEVEDAPSLFLNQEPRTVVAEHAHSIPPIDTFGFLDPSIDQPPHRSNPVLERKTPIGLGIYCDGLDVCHLLADDLSSENEDAEACVLQQPVPGHIAEVSDIRSIASDVHSDPPISEDSPVRRTFPHFSIPSMQLQAQAIFPSTSVESTQIPAQYALDGASSPRHIEPPEYNQLTPPLGLPNVATDVASNSTGQLPSNGPAIQSLSPFLPNSAQAAYAAAMKRNKRTKTLQNVSIRPDRNYNEAQSPAGTPNVPPNTFQTPRSNIDPTIASFVVTINSSPEAIASLDKKDKHSSIKVCCYALIIFIPLAILLALMTLVYFVHLYKPGEGWYHKCWDATKTSDTLLICKGLLEDYCFNAVGPNVLDRCARAGYYPDGTVTHVW